MTKCYSPYCEIGRGSTCEVIPVVWSGAFAFIVTGKRTSKNTLHAIRMSFLYPAHTKHLYNIFTMLVQRRRRWADVVQILYKCFVLAGYVSYPCIL